MAGLLDVPLEMLLQITSYLTTSEYGNLRRTCKRLEVMLFGDFAKEFFSKRQFALTEFSIQALVDIAKSRLGPSLTHLIIHLEHPYQERQSNPVPPPVPFSEIERKENCFLIECINHYQFITTGLDAEMLTDAVKHLPNLETIGMRDFNSKNRNRDNTEWHSYGCPTLMENIHFPSLSLPEKGHLKGRGPEYTSHVFLTILRAIGNAALSGSNLKITRFEVLLHTCILPDYSFRIPRHFEAVVSLALSRLTTLLLDGLTEQVLWSELMVRGDDGNAIIAAGYFLSRFLARTPGLEHLRLNFQTYKRSSTERFLTWLAGAREITMDVVENAPDDFLVPFPSAPHLPNLRDLDIGMASVSEPVLLALYRNYKSTLRGISLHKVVLEGRADANTNLWAHLCSRMARAGLEIRKIRLSFLRQRSRSRRAGVVTFKLSRNKNVKSWRGSAFSQAIKDIIKEMELSRDDLGDDSDDVSMDDDDDDDEDDDEESFDEDGFNEEGFDEEGSDDDMTG
ncbi:hypothetical protein F5Y10DRAFT_228248 [Nemania abortiva]|nr:hypothetical protein F5Y10DRAFT_228248 [Nemania abortiva]